ncbi:24035_t:CDS:2, partial [Racocetra persica]
PDILESSICTNIAQRQQYIYGFGITKSELKFAVENGLVDEFIELITRFIENHTDLAIGNKENSRLAKQVNVKANKGGVKLKLENRHCSNCHGPGHYTST